MDALKTKMREICVEAVGVVTKSWVDKKFKEQLLTNPKKTLENSGYFAGLYNDIKVHDYGNDKTLHLNMLYPPPHYKQKSK